jgi:3-deoxy-manno-octulosonate cytidylyltransferase (CMP-KDO synthetase)
MNFQKPQVLAVIPARYGSSRFPGKPLADISGKTLIQRTYENARRCQFLNDIIVATDDQRIYDHIIEFGGKVIMTSPHCPTGTDRLIEVISQNEHLKSFPIIINVQGDEPCLNPETIAKVGQCLIDDPSAVMSTAVVKIESEEEATTSSSVKCVFDKQGNALYFSRSLIPGHKNSDYNPSTSYYRHLGIYGFRHDFLIQYGQLLPTPLQQTEDLEQLKVLEHGYKIKVAIVNDLSIGVDHPQDIINIEHILCKK